MANDHICRRRAAAAIFLILAFAAGPRTLRADALAEGQHAFALRDYDSAYRLLLPLAEKGQSDAQLKVGFMLYYGLGVGRSFTDSLRWTLPAAEKGNPMAQHLASRMYLRGWGTAPDPEKSFFWCRKAADQGLPDALGCLGEYYAQGTGTARNSVLGADYLFKAGMAFLKEGRRDMALSSVERIRALVSPDHFLAYRLLDEIYGEGKEDEPGSAGMKEYQ